MRGMRFRRIIIMMFLVMLVDISCSTRESQTAKQQKEIEMRKEERRKKEEAAYQSKIERHEKIQSEEGRKLIQQANEHRNKLDKQNNKKKFSLKNLFGKDEPACH
ncbi:MAG TPA: hypothetical protein PLX24_08280 [Bacteroidales bacterium]|nr:MAG: hypothetical protein BWX51_01625 [Bacteroidetes bacterium ADurb.Bin012]HOC16166.1 hypothetical protein [Bacteroidales bacterium]HOX81248.1 hypothetical protein [Bacteroidales bacterium]HPV35311.1 hypothetical protein [Bacteroidales bacterium]HQF19106.1 hypothetical protein [Bacteroidales bacterium]